MKYKLKIWSVLIFLSVVVLAPYSFAPLKVFAQAQKPAPTKTNPPAPPKPGTTPQTPTKPAEVEIPQVKNPIKSQSVSDLMAKVIRIIFGLMGSAAVVVIILGGFKMAVSSANPAERSKGKSMILWAAVGLVVSLMAFSIISIVQSLIKN